MQPNKQKSGAILGILLPMGLVCLFALCSLMLAMIGGRAYKQVQATVDDAHNSSVAAGYLRTKLAQNNQSGAIALRNEDGVQVLVITVAMQDSAAVLETRIHYNNGRLLEETVPADEAFEPGYGTRIALLEDCRFALTPEGLFTADLVGPAPQYTTTHLAFAIAEGGRL
ncbi:DUF4860 domain-containing protein [Ruminococcaceae bacterium OttesenSCG-928-O06]|nr:DUF4860 domain-containing protein [Ruminococcaceae bacterium OttesenSCG-928-O06]